MRDLNSTALKSSEARPINILRVASPDSQSGYVLYSGISTHTIMASTSTTTPSSCDDAGIRMASRATQTENSREARASSQSHMSTSGKTIRHREVIVRSVKKHSCLAGANEDVNDNKEKLIMKNRQQGILSQKKDSVYDKYKRVEVTKTKSKFRQVKEEPFDRVKNHCCKNSKLTSTTRDSSTPPSVTTVRPIKAPNREKNNSSKVTKEMKSEETISTEKGCTQVPQASKGAFSDNGDLHENERTHASEEDSKNATTDDLEPTGHTNSQTNNEIQRREPNAGTLPQSCNKTVDSTSSLPLVSWKERLVPSRQEIPVSLYSSMFEHIPPPAILSHTPRILVSPKHTCPEGLSSKDIILGVCINPSNNRPGNVSNPEDEFKSQEDKIHRGLQRNRQNSQVLRRVKSAVVSSHLNFTDDTHERKRPFTVHNGVLPRPTTSPPTFAVNLELSIISLNPNRNQPNQNPMHSHEPKDNHQMNESQACSTSKLDTITAIKRSYHRIQSAPPLTSGRGNARQHGDINGEPGDQSDQVKTFSSLYWRAKSAYHKRIQSVKDADTFLSNADGLDNIGGRTEEAAQLQGTLLRPLLYTSEEGFMRHNAGCPYKCKNCFKACLVSDDFARKAKQKLHTVDFNVRQPTAGQGPRESHLRLFKSGSKNNPRSTTKRRVDAITIVQRALARSQPPFRQVYGVKGHPQSIRPWPSYAWTDIKLNRSDVKEVQACDENVEK